MCVTFTLSPTTKHAKLDADELAAVSGLSVRRKAAGTLELCPRDGCPCDFVGHGSATDAGWPLRPDLKPAVRTAVTLAAHRLKRFRLTATWLDDPVSWETSVSLSEMLQIIESGGIGRKSFLIARD